MKLAGCFAANQIALDTERCCRYQLRNFAQFMETEQGNIGLEDVSAVDLPEP